MKIELATQPTKNLYRYSMIGFPFDVIYHVPTQRLIVSNLNTGAFIRDENVKDNLDFETFVLVAENIHLDMIDKCLVFPFNIKEFMN